MLGSTLFSLAGLLAAVSAMPKPLVGTPKPLPSPDIAKIMAQPQANFTSYQTGGLVRQGSVAALNTTASGVHKRWTCSTSATLTWGDNDNGGLGVTINNADSDWRGYYFYHNSCDSVPYKYIWVAAGATQFVSLPAGWEGRVQRGVDSSMLNGQSQWLGSWFEITLDSNNVMWADISLIRGCDGGILVWGLDAAQAWKGFTQWILDGAPSDAYAQKTDGIWVINANEGSTVQVTNPDGVAWEISKVGINYVYVDDHHGNPVVSSSNGRFGSYWPAGRA